MKRALICGVSGQDGAYLAQLLLRQGYAVTGTSRDAQSTSFANLDALGVRAQLRLISLDLTDYRDVALAIDTVQPDEIYNLAGQSSVARSFAQPAQAMASIGIAALNLLEAVRFSGAATRVYSAGSSECFGANGELPCNEETPFRPRSPYAVAKASAHWQVANYREAYDLFACTGILFNHESPLRQAHFVTRKIISAVAAIARGATTRLTLGNLSISRDWGWAPEYVQAMWLMLQQPVAQDLVIATGHSHRLEDFVAAAFAQIGRDWRDHVDTDPALFRPTELIRSAADPSRAQQQLGWSARIDMAGVIERMLAAELAATG